MRPAHSSILHRFGIALAFGLVALAPGNLHAQYLDGVWAYSDLASGYGGFQGFEVPGYSDPGFGFGLPGFSDGNMAPFTSFGDSPYFGMGTTPPGVDSEVADVSGYLNREGYLSGDNERAQYRPRIKTKVKVKARRGK